MASTGLSKRPRTAGILVPIFSLRSEHDLGIGDVACLKEFIQLLSELGFGFVQLLPINETGPDNSPYNAISSIALDPLSIDCSSETLVDLSDDDYVEICGSVDLATLRSKGIDYATVRSLKHRLLRRAFARFLGGVYDKINSRSDEFKEFCDQEADWLNDYCIYRMLMDREDGSQVWQDWDEKYNTHEKALQFVADWFRESPEESDQEAMYYAYVQWIAWSQWKEVVQFAEDRDVELMGDIPYGISFSSVDVFSHPEYFQSDWYGGAPPERVFQADPFVEKWGQNWGIPLYDWDCLKEQDYKWWKDRVRKTTEIFSAFRVDHALGFYRIYSFPWSPLRNEEFLPLSHEEAAERCEGRLPGFLPRDDSTEESARENQRDGEKYLRMIQDAAGEAQVIAEDLGQVPDYVRPSLEKLGIAGMKVPQWEFTDGKVTSGVSYPAVSFATYATHDHAPMRTQWESMQRQMAENEEGSPEWTAARDFLQIVSWFSGFQVADENLPDYGGDLRKALFRQLSLSNSERIAIMITDFLDDPNSINVPGIMDDSNWSFRMQPTIKEVSESEDWAGTCGMFTEILLDTGRAPTLQR